MLLINFRLVKDAYVHRVIDREISEGKFGPRTGAFASYNLVNVIMAGELLIPLVS